MKALQYVSAGRPVFADHPDPAPGQGEVLVRIEAITTCPHWDMHLMRNEPMFPGASFSYPYPVGQPGHEAAGVVEQVGPGVTSLKPGMRVAAWRDPGQTRSGSYAQFNVFDEETLLQVPDAIPYEKVASLELAMCVQVTFDRLLAGDLIRGKRVAVSGMGPAGLVAIQMARAYGAREVVAVEPVAERRAVALTLGADEAWGPGEDGIQAIKRHTPEAFDVAIDCTGLKVSIEYLMDRTTHAVSIFGVLREEITFAPRHWVGLSLIGYESHNREAGLRALHLIEEGRLDLAPLVSETMPLSRYREGIDLLFEKKAIKVCFLPWEKS